MISRDNVVSLSGQKLGGQRVTLDSQTAALVGECRIVAGDSLRRLLQAMFDRLDDALYETADKAESHNVQFRYLDAMRDMRKQRASIEAVFIGQALDYYDEFWRTGGIERKAGGGGVAEPGELSLVGEDELEETLAINALVSKGESRFERQLGGLKQRFGKVIGRPDLPDDENPVGPAALAKLYRFHIDPRETGDGSRLLKASTWEGWWACEFHTNCRAVCPRGVPPNVAIGKARAELQKSGHNAPGE